MDSPTTSPAILHVRSMAPGDISFILNSWIESYRSCRETWGWDKDEYCAVQTKVIKALLARCNVAIACDPEDHDQIFGWCAWEDHDRYVIVHYIYTKFLFQRMGVARRLWTEVVNPTGKDVLATHAGPDSFALKEAGHKFRIKPFALVACVLGNTKETQ